MPIERGTLAGHANVLSAFYGAYPYPWRPMHFDFVDDPEFFWSFAKQETGRFELGPVHDIWVAGCGTNQALITALQYPEAKVLGTDASAQSLEICESNAVSVGVTNLRLEQQGIVESTREEQFDLVICTGVIHHNPDPGQCLARLSAAMRADALLELMVYNKFHRREHMAFQEALRILIPDDDVGSRDRLSAARSLAGSFKSDSTLAQYLTDQTDNPDEVWADNWMNPCERSYDVDTLWDLASKCCLTIEAPKVNMFDRTRDRFWWTLDLDDPGLQESFLALDDRARWQLVNLLQLDTSPLLWFYLRPDPDGTGHRVTEEQRNQFFMDRVPTIPSANRRMLVLGEDERYHLSPQATAIRKRRPRAEVGELWSAVDGKSTMREIFAKVGRPTDFNTVYLARLMLTTAELPHLIMHTRGNP